MTDDSSIYFTPIIAHLHLCLQMFKGKCLISISESMCTKLFVIECYQNICYKNSFKIMGKKPGGIESQKKFLCLFGNLCGEKLIVVTVAVLSVLFILLRTTSIYLEKWLSASGEKRFISM